MSSLIVLIGIACDLEANFHKQFKHPQLKSLLWQAAHATTEAMFNEALTNMSKIDERSVDWLLQHADPKHWAELYFVGKRYGHLTLNIAESLNLWILKAINISIPTSQYKEVDFNFIINMPYCMQDCKPHT